MPRKKKEIADYPGTTHCEKCKKYVSREELLYLREDKLVCRSCCDKIDGRVRKRENGDDCLGE